MLNFFNKFWYLATFEIKILGSPFLNWDLGIGGPSPLSEPYNFIRLFKTNCVVRV